MAKRITVVVSQGQSASPVKRKLEEDLVAALLFERGVEVNVVPHLYDLKPDGTGVLCLQGITGDLVVVSWLYERAARWILDRHDVRGREGKSLLVAPSDDEVDNDEDEEVEGDAKAETNGDVNGEANGGANGVPAKERVVDSRPLPKRTIYCLDFRVKEEVAPIVDEIRRIVGEAQVQTVGLIDLGGNGKSLPIVTAPAAGRASSPAAPAAAAPAAAPDDAPAAAAPVAPLRVEEAAGRRWYPVIDYARCTNCMECIDFCLFGVYGIDKAETILVEQPDNCRKGCPACSRVCPENAIMFPQHKSPAIAGSHEGAAGGLKIDLSLLFGAPDPLEQAVRERDVELVAAGRDAVGMSTGIPKRRTDRTAGPKDELDSLLDQLDELDL